MKSPVLAHAGRGASSDSDPVEAVEPTVRIFEEARMSSQRPRPTLIALTPEAAAVLGGAEATIRELPFRVGRESRGVPPAAGRTIA